MSIAVQLVLVIALLYAIGSLTYAGTAHDKGDGKYRFLLVLWHLLLMFLMNGALFVLLSAVAVLIVSLIDFALYGAAYEQLELDTAADVFNVVLGRFPGGSFLLLLLILIFSTAIVSFLLRGWRRRKKNLWVLNEESYEIGEYFIQWITIYVAVYQFFFDGLHDIVSLLSTAETAKEIFNIALSPRNVNLVAQPILISTWILVVMEKLRLRNSGG